MSRFLFRVIHVAIFILLRYECMHEDCVFYLFIIIFRYIFILLSETI